MSVAQPAPRLIAMKGHPATGKSLLARALAQQLRWPLIDKDDIKDHTLPVANGNVLAYAIMWQVVETQLALGVSVIADSPLSYPIGYDTALQLTTRHGAQLFVVETILDETLWRRRLDARAPNESSHKIRGWDAMQRQLALYDGCWRYAIDPAQHIRVDTGQPVAQLVTQVQQRITGGGA